MRKFFVICLLVCSLTSLVVAQNTAGDASTIEPRYIIDTPTAGLLKRGAFSFESNFFQDGGVMFGLYAGALDRLTFGVSYGGVGIIGKNAASMQKLPGVMLKYRLFEESVAMPAIAFGFDSQGKETYIDSLERFTIKSRGIFIAASKNYSMLGFLSFHGGVNWSMEKKDGDKDMDVFCGLEKSLGQELSLLAEYDFAFNDNNNDAYGKGYGYLNAGIRWSLASGLTLGFDLKNIVKNQNNVTFANRTLKVEYIRTF
ncbi:MAG: YjbH domain-containing protein [Bacteroidota bacterium]|nr:YjbH domain-containing protein [Bacteroidota bacterium]